VRGQVTEYIVVDQSWGTDPQIPSVRYTSRYKFVLVCFREG